MSLSHFSVPFSLDPYQLPPVMRDAVEEVRRRTQAPHELIFASALGATALACQERFDVMRPTGNISPVSLFVLTIAESGERKTTVDNWFQRPIKNVEQGRVSFDGVRQMQYPTELKIWEKAQKEALKKVYEAVSQGVHVVSAMAEFSLERNRPAAPENHRIIYANSTLEAVLNALKGVRRSIGLISDEGGVVLDSRVSQHLSSLNVLWEGGAIHVDRVSKPSFSVSDARLTISLMAQPGVFRKFIGKRKSEARDLGFLARALTCYPRSTQGSRDFRKEEIENQKHSNLNPTIERIMRKFNRSNEREALTFSQDAASAWISFSNEVEFHLGRNRYFSEVKDFASKLADNVSRIGALFEITSSGERMNGLIGLNSINSAIHVGRWYAGEFVRLFGESAQISEDYELATLLSEFMLNKAMNFDSVMDGWFEASEILKKGPSKLRNARNLNAAISYLESQGRLDVRYEGGKRTIRRVSLV